MFCHRVDPFEGMEFWRKVTPHIQKLSDESDHKLWCLSYWVFSFDQTRMQPQHIPPMTDGEGFMGTYFPQGNSGDWLDQLPVHFPTHGYILQVGQGIHSLHVREEEPPIANLEKPFVIPIIKISSSS